MTYIKKLVMKGFKSFARETVMELDRHMNVIVGPNGSGKSNVTDALCFVLGRLSIKSIRAAKASHLIFSGNKQYKGGNYAVVEIILDNSDKTFVLEDVNISIKRIVKKNGQSTYKINNETKTRQEVLELLGTAGIDPHGFNIVLQGEIENFVKMHPEARRKVIEEVAGISIYEMRKEKSIKELDKTEERLKQIKAVLKERTNYLRNLENEREQALRFKKLEETVKKCKASIINKHIQEKDRGLKEILDKIHNKKKEIDKTDIHIGKIKEDMNLLNERINNISSIILKSSGLEQDQLTAEISILKQEIAGLIARKENFENQLHELNRRKLSLNESLKLQESEISDISKEKGKDSKKELIEKKKKLEDLEDGRRQFYLLKSNLSSINSQIEDKKRQIQMLKNDSNYILTQIESIEKDIKIHDNNDRHTEKIVQLKHSIEKHKTDVIELEENLLEKSNIKARLGQIIEQSQKVKDSVSKLDICPLCKTKITKDHIKEVIDKSNKDINNSKKIIEDSDNEIEKLKVKLKEIKERIANNSIEVNQRNIDILKTKTISEKKSQLKRNTQNINSIEDELKNLETKKKSIDSKLSLTSLSEEQYESLKLEVNELQRTEERDLGTEITAKKRELERMNLAIKQITRDKEIITEDLLDINESLEDKQEIVKNKEDAADILKKKYQKMFEEKNSLQDKVRDFETTMMNLQNDKRNIENEKNNLMIEKAQVSARKESYIDEAREFQGVELISMSIEKLTAKLNDAENILSRIGNVNMRALEVYDSIKDEYDKINEKVLQLEKEKLEILSVIEKIDKKKKKTFIITLNRINELFSRNFSQLSVKGIVTIEPQNKKELFESGLDIIVKVGGGKYFDVTSLSGGEQTLVALSLIFAIQEYRPYCFYIFDEIDAALDRRNSEKLAYLLKKYMKDDQYLIITHNDSLISESSNILYGVSMQEGISKVLSIQL